MATASDSGLESSSVIRAPVRVEAASDSPSLAVATAEAPPELANFESIYSQAQGDPAKVPWARCRPNPMMVAWLNAEGPALVRPGSRVVVVGCGLGDDVVALCDRGYDVVGFDVSPTAINWARARFPDQASCFAVGDLLALPGRFRHRYDLVVETYTLQSLHPSLREDAAAAVGSLVSPRGLVLAICRSRDEAELLENVQGPPYPLTLAEIAGLMESVGLRPLRPIDDFLDDETPPVRRLRGAFVHA
jgi:SAM-dependent methyltransferase